MAEEASRPLAAVAERRGPNGELSAWTDALLVGVALAYAAFVTLLTLLRDVPITPDVLLVAVGFVLVIVIRKRFSMLREWTPFLVLFLAYELMRGLADEVGLPVHVGDVAAIERSLFDGHLPTALLQEWLHPATGTDWLAVAGTVVYYFHFILPLVTAFLLWRLRPLLFHPYLISLILLSFAGFATYLLLPVAPPWLAAELGQIGALPGEPVVRDLKLHAFTAVVGGLGLDGEGLYDVAFISLSANPVAAFPSLHSAFAFLSFLVLRRAFGAMGWLGLAYFGAVAFTIVYSADHYVVDVLGGMAYASAAYGLMWLLVRRLPWRHRAAGVASYALNPLATAGTGRGPAGRSGGDGDAQQPGQEVAEEIAGHARERAEQQDLQARP